MAENQNPTPGSADGGTPQPPVNPPAAPANKPPAGGTPEPPVEPQPKPPAAPEPPAPHMVPASTVDEARSQERTKVRGRIEALEQELGSLKSLVEQQKTIIDEQNKKLAEGQKFDVDAVANQAVTLAEARLKGQYETTVRQLRGQVEQLQKDSTRQRLELRKKELIEAAGGPEKLVMEIVRGESEEELVRNVQLAQQAYQRIVAATATPVPPPVSGEPGGINTPTPQPHAAGTPVPTSVTSPASAGPRKPNGEFDREAWELQRKEVLPMVNARFRQQVSQSEGLVG